jgi:hypothetical protein
MGSETASVFDHPEIWLAIERRLDKRKHGEGKYVPLTSDEVQFAIDLAREYTHHDVERVLDVGCRLCPYGIAMRRLGFDVTGIDGSEAMLRVAAARAQAAGVELSLHRCDLDQFELPGARFDGAISLASTPPFGRALASGFDFNRACVSHLHAVAAALRPGSLYVLDWGHRRDANPRRLRRPHKWFDEALPFAAGVAYWRMLSPPDDVEGNVRTYVQTCDVEYANGETLHTVDRWHLPWMDPPGYIMALVELSGVFDWVGMFEFGNTSPATTAREDHPMWAVLRRV